MILEYDIRPSRSKQHKSRNQIEIPIVGLLLQLAEESPLSIQTNEIHIYRTLPKQTGGR